MRHYRPLLAGAVLIGVACWVASEYASRRVADAGFWFEDVTYASPRLGSAITDAELETIAAIARSELIPAPSYRKLTGR
jgi:hypothetical protein